MIKRQKIFFIVNIILFICVFMLPNFVHAINPEDYDPSKKPISGTAVDEITSKANNIIGIITTVGIVISVITMLILGLKYMIGSVEEKAEYKKTMIPYIIGVVFIVAISTIVSIIANMVESLNK